MSLWKKCKERLLTIPHLRTAALLCMDVLVILICMMAIYYYQLLCIGNYDHFGWHMLLLGVCLIVFQFVFRNYRSLWSYAEGREYLRLLAASGCGYLLYLLLTSVIPFFENSFLPISLSLLSAVLPTVLMLAIRMLYRRYRDIRARRSQGVTLPVMIIGAGHAGISLLDEMLRNTSSGYSPVCVVDDDFNKIGNQVRGVPIVGPIANLQTFARKFNVQEVLIAIPSAKQERLREILDICTALKCRVRLLPDILEMVGTSGDGGLFRNIREVRIEDLLGRDPVMLDNRDIYRFLSGRVVMVTGGGGSIGSELCRQIAKQHPKQLIVVDIYENNAYAIQQELKFAYGAELDLKIEIASVRDAHKIDCLFERYHPEIVFHAAAHKHVPLMETCPEEAIRNNVFGTYHVADAADRYGADRFILISTDKAVNPTNVMGASKRLCEMVVQGMAENSKTQFAAVRFGNVLGSNGSVIPLFQQQIQNGGPVTVTDKRIIRYFMTIPEAAQLVLCAGTMASRSEIFVLDMGKPVSILELAENLVRLSGFTPYVDMQIVETGLRPGEKLYEELLMRNEDLAATTNHKIFIERQKEPVTKAQLAHKLDQLEQVLTTDSPDEIIAVMKQLVPTYKDPETVNGNAIADLDYSKDCESILS